MRVTLMTLITLLAISSASADMCTVALEQHDRYNTYVTETFIQFDYNQQNACDNALQECRQEIRERRRWDRSAKLTCAIQSRGTGNGRNDRRCSFDLKSPSGVTLDRFSRQSCRVAEETCMSYLVERNRRGRDLRAKCVQSSR